MKCENSEVVKHESECQFRCIECKNCEMIYKYSDSDWKEIKCTKTIDEL